MFDGITTDKWESFSQAPIAFWLVIGLTVVALLGFIIWTSRSRNVPHSIGPGVLGGLVGLFIVWTFFLYLVPALTATAVPTTERTWAWEPGELLQDPGGSDLVGEPYRGYQLYIAQSCVTCHTMYVRPQDIGTGWAEGVGGGDVARAEDYVLMSSPPLGTQRNGPDLAWIGRRIPDMTYQIDHLVDPRKYKPNSIMPTYRHLSDQDLADLAAFLVTLGNSKEELLAGTVAGGVDTSELSPSAQLGQEIYRGSLGCVGCHTINGDPNLGPTWLGLWGSERELEDGSVVIADEEYLIESIVDPSAKVVKGFMNVMPPFGNFLSDEEIQGVVDFIRELGG